MALFMSKQISQSSFDDIVKENMVEFDMSLDDAVQEAISQLTSQGIDLTKIDTTGGVGRDEVIGAISILVEYSSTSQSPYSDVVQAIDNLKAITATSHPMSKRNTNLVLSSALTPIINLVAIQTTPEVLLGVLELLRSLAKSDVSCRDKFEHIGTDKICRLMSSCLASLESKGYDDVVLSVFSLARTIVTKAENIKNSFMQLGIGDILIALFDRGNTNTIPKSISAEVWNKILTEAFLLVRGLCSFDDMRKEMSCAFDNSRYFANSLTAVTALMTSAAKFKESPRLASAAMLATKQLMLSEDSVKIVADNGGMEVPRAILSDAESSTELVRSVAALLRNLCADDNRKNKLVQDGTMNALVNTLSEERYLSDSSLVEHTFATLAAMALRQPQNSRLIVEANGIHAVIRGMKKHPSKDGVQRHACLIVRNISARCPDLHPQIIDAGIESVLRDAGKLQGAVDHAYAALRDLGIEVQYVKVQEDGSMQPVYESFGQKNPNFNSNKFDTVSDFDEIIEREGKAPFSQQQEHACRDDCNH